MSDAARARPPEPDAAAPRGPLARALREPPLHFLLIGAGVFGAYALLRDPPPPPPERIVVTEALVDQLRAVFEATWRRPPSAVEMSHMLEDFVREEVLVREALALGMDRGDLVIRQRLRQKMEFLTASLAGAAEPPEEVLRAWFDERAARFAAAPRLGFRQVFLGPEAEAAGPVRAALAAGAPPEAAGLPTLLPPELPPSSPPQVDATFGAGFFEALAALPPEAGWQGPVRSGYGFHLVQVTVRERGGAPSFESVRDKVPADWRTAKTGELLDAQVEELMSRHDIVRDLSPTAE